MKAEHASLKEVSNQNLYDLLSKLIYLISHGKQHFHVMHRDLPGAVTQGNRRADALAMPVQVSSLPDTFQQAKLSHQFYHQNVHALMRMFHLS